jgi:small-conductance mechanosensitive channel
MVLEDLSLFEGVRRAWEVASKKVGPVLLIWLITALVGLIVGFVIALPVLLIVVPAAVGYFTTGREISSAFLVAGGVCLTIYLPVLVLAGGILTAYIESVWTLTFLRLTRLPQDMEGLATSPVNA